MSYAHTQLVELAPDIGLRIPRRPLTEGRTMRIPHKRNDTGIQDASGPGLHELVYCRV
jgi:hypothetical protein